MCRPWAADLHPVGQWPQVWQEPTTGELKHRWKRRALQRTFGWVLWRVTLSLLDLECLLWLMKAWGFLTTLSCQQLSLLQMTIAACCINCHDYCPSCWLSVSTVALRRFFIWRDMKGFVFSPFSQGENLPPRVCQIRKWQHSTTQERAKPIISQYNPPIFQRKISTLHESPKVPKLRRAQERPSVQPLSVAGCDSAPSRSGGAMA